MRILNLEVRRIVPVPPEKKYDVTILGLGFNKMTKQDYYGFAGAGPNSVIRYDEDSIHEYFHSEDIGDTNYNVWTVQRF
jgi:hypothetical protein